MFCSKCGTENKETAKFCYNCGEKLEMEEKVIPDPEDASEAETMFLPENHADERLENQANEETDIPLPPVDEAVPPETAAPVYVPPVIQQAPPVKQKSSKKLILILASVFAGILLIGIMTFTGMNIYKHTRPVAPVNNFMTAFMNQDWETLYDNVEFTEEYISKYEFVQTMQEEFSGGLNSIYGAALTKIASGVEVSAVSAGTEYYDRDLGMTVRDIPVSIRVKLLDISLFTGSVKVAKTGASYALFFPTWKIVDSSLDGLFDNIDDMIYDYMF